MAYYATYMPNELGELQKVVINAGVGFVLPYYGETAPPGTLACDGSEISRTVYDELFAVLGTKAGAGDGSTTFNVPDLRGMFIRGTGGNAAELGVEQGDAIRNLFGAYEIMNPSNDVYLISSANGIFYQTMNDGENRTSLQRNSTEYQGNTIHVDTSRIVPVANENRPVNVALLWCIIYE